MKIINPANNEMLKDIPEDNTQSVKQKFDHALVAQKEWGLLPLAQRLAMIKKFHDLMQDERDVLAADLSREMGKPLQEAINEVNGACYRIRFFLEQSDKWLTTNKIHQEGNTSEMMGFDPLGVICNISAWNYPFLVGVNVFIPALLAGNAVMYKPSEFATLTGLNIDRLIHQAGVPNKVFATVVGGAKVGEMLLDLPCHGYFFTGSYKTGKYIAERVASKLVPVGLELGGKDPLYVADDIADVKKVANAVAEGCFYNNGQSCCAVERVYVHEKIYDQFLQNFISEVAALKVGNPADKSTQQGAIARPVHVEFLETQLKDALAKGAKLEIGGKRSSGAGSFFPPTVVTNVNHQMKVMMEETFGPIIGVMKVKDDQQAVELMNDCEYGLTAAVYCANTDRAKKILAQVDAGTSYINCCDRVSPYLPWAGRKHSGLGSTLSYLGILAFAKPRSWHIRTP
jgi:acyl-CoA reductase-like NAD-dependent aldehyde dehydrogenase